jgi:hypothetical protein
MADRQGTGAGGAAERVFSHSQRGGQARGNGYVVWSQSISEKGMKRVLLAVCTGGLLAGCTVVSPEVGQEAVLVDRPWLFG